jgi:hypothetical protein
MRKHLTYAAIAGVVAAPLATVPATADVRPAAATRHAGGPGFATAYGIAADGLISIPRIPEVTSEERPASRNVLEIPGNPLVELSVLRARALPGHADASAVDLKIAKVAISPEAVLTAKLISARCDDGFGASRLVGVRLAGRPIQAAASPNSTLTVPIAGLGGVQVTINKQVRNPDGTVTVTGLELAIAALGQSQTVDVASATCAPGPIGGGGEAPRPNPVPRDLPVTG